MNSQLMMNEGRCMNIEWLQESLGNHCSKLALKVTVQCLSCCCHCYIIKRLIEEMLNKLFTYLAVAGVAEAAAAVDAPARP